MLALSDPLITPEWVATLPVLKVEDVRGLSEALVGESEGKRRPSWIWTMGDLGGGSGDEGTCVQADNQHTLTTKLNE